MSRDARFWRNVALVAVAHLALLLALARASREADKPNLQSIVWMNADAALASVAAAKTAETAPTPPPEPSLKPEAALPTPTPGKSEIQLPSPTPTATLPPKPSPTPSPKSSPKPTEKPTPKPSPKKSASPKPTATPKASPKNEKKPDEKKKPVDEKKPANKEPASGSDKAADKSSSPGTGNGAAKGSEFSWYGTMLHDRFYKAWEQPTSVVATGAKMSTIVKIRIEKDGRVSKFAIVKPSGNVVVDESVAAIAQRVTQVDPLPEGLAKGAFYEVKIDFELNAEK
jgi:TonB family protein